jgi:hypothetical protein
MSEMLISVGAEQASDAWGFVGVVKVGDHEAYRTLEAFTTPSDASAEAQRLMATVLGELLAGCEWRQMRDQLGSVPLRRDFAMDAFKKHGGIGG